MPASGSIDSGRSRALLGCAAGSILVERPGWLDRQRRCQARVVGVDRGAAGVVEGILGQHIQGVSVDTVGRARAQAPFDRNAQGDAGIALVDVLVNGVIGEARERLVEDPDPNLCLGRLAALE